MKNDSKLPDDDVRVVSFKKFAASEDFDEILRHLGVSKTSQVRGQLWAVYMCGWYDGKAKTPPTFCRRVVYTLKRFRFYLPF